MNKVSQASKKSLTSHFIVMSGLCALLQIIIAVRDSKIDLVAYLLLIVVALYYAYYNYTSRHTLRKLRFGRLVSHLVGFLIVNLSYHIHAYILFVTHNPAIEGNENFAINPEWFGVLFGMMSFWGIGLFIHLIASISRRGFEEVGV